ncbi:unnamed protein product, partial [Ectocarpus sp. 8 AP-2014]
SAKHAATHRRWFLHEFLHTVGRCFSSNEHYERKSVTDFLRSELRDSRPPSAVGFDGWFDLFFLCLFAGLSWRRNKLTCSRTAKERRWPHRVELERGTWWQTACLGLLQ